MAATRDAVDEVQVVVVEHPTILLNKYSFLIFKVWMKNCVPDVGIVPSSISKIGTLAHA